MRWLCLILCMAACAPRPTVDAAFLSHGWRLSSINGQPFSASATLNIHRSGRVAGTTPCTAFASTLTRFPPGWEFGPISLHNAACPQGHAEAAFVRAITQVTRADVQGVRMILSGPATELIFVREKR
jgi:heat shock protein HslJ